MSDHTSPAIPRWPFYLGDVLLLLVAGLIYWQGGHAPGQGYFRFSAWEAWALVACVALGGILGVWPHVLEYRAAARFAEAQHLDHAVLQVQNIEAVARQISSATANWQAVQDDAGKAVAAAREIAESMTTEARAFQEFLQKANDTERNHLRLEVDKLRRTEAEWLQVVTRILDHTFAIHQAAVRSGQPGLIEQLGHFQHACREVARRVGLVPFEASAGEPYDPKIHQLADASAPLPPEPVVADTLAPGIRYQGRAARLPLVTVKGARAEESDAALRDVDHGREQARAAGPVEQPAPVDEEPTPEAAEPAPAELVETGADPDAAEAMADEAVVPEPEPQSRRPAADQISGVGLSQDAEAEGDVGAGADRTPSDEDERNRADTQEESPEL